MDSFHGGLTTEKWSQYDMMSQLGNIGSEVGRARIWKDKDKNVFQGAVNRALELFYLTIEDKKWRGLRLKELLRAKECFVDALYGGKEYGSTLEDLDRYFFNFALLARRGR